MRTKMTSRVALRKFPTLMLAPVAAVGLATVISVGPGASVCVAQDANPSTDATAETTAPIGPQGPYYSRPLPPGAGIGGFPPMGFDPMTGTVAPNTGPGDVYGQTMDNRAAGSAGGNTGGDAQIDVQVRGRIGMGGQGTGRGQGGAHGLGNPGWGGYAGQGAPFRNGYGAPYGTPFSMGPAAPQYAPQASETEPAETQPDDSGTSSAAASPTSAPQANPAYPAGPSGPTFPQPFTWAPSGMPVPGLSSGSSTGAYVQPQGTAPSAQQPDWVTERRAEAEKRRLEAEKRFTEMRNNNFYAGRGYGPGYGQGFGSGYGQPYGQGYGAPYGVPYGAPYGYAPQPAPQPQETPKSEDKTN